MRNNNNGRPWRIDVVLEGETTREHLEKISNKMKKEIEKADTHPTIAFYLKGSNVEDFYSFYAESNIRNNEVQISISGHTLDQKDLFEEKVKNLDGEVLGVWKGNSTAGNGNLTVLTSVDENYYLHNIYKESVRTSMLLKQGDFFVVLDDEGNRKEYKDSVKIEKDGTLGVYQSCDLHDSIDVSSAYVDNIFKTSVTPDIYCIDGRYNPVRQQVHKF